MAFSISWDCEAGMNEPFRIDDDAAAYLGSFLEHYANTSRYPLSLEGMLERWTRIVIEVEEGYGDSIYEYANDVAIRDVLRRIEIDGPSSLRSSLAAYLEPLDRRFFEATNETSRSLPGLVSSPGSPWRTRLPKNPQGELLSDLRAADLI
jgi:hypothetical protein